MADRARLAKLPQPEAALKCPRCESTNTKFCYFNNYSLTQPRHFCKTCRRYWTRGGALRNVPVGGGCRRNKKSKSNNRSKSPVSTERPMGGSSSTNLMINPSGSDVVSRLLPPPQQNQSSSFMLSIQNHLSRFAGGGGGGGNLGLNFSEIQVPGDIGFPMGGNSGGNNVMLPGGEADQWRLQQFPPLMGNGFDSSSSSGLYPFQVGTEGVVEPVLPPMVGESQLIRNFSSSRVSQINNNPPVKREDNHQGLNLSSSRPTLNAISENNNQFWGGSPWSTDISGGLNSSSSSSHLL